MSTDQINCGVFIVNSVKYFERNFVKSIAASASQYSRTIKSCPIIFTCKWSEHCFDLQLSRNEDILKLTPWTKCDLNLGPILDVLIIFCLLFDGGILYVNHVIEIALSIYF